MSAAVANRLAASLGQRLENDLIQLRRDVRTDLRRHRHRLGDDRHHRLELGVPLVEPPASQHLVQHDAEREDVAAAVDRVVLALLRRQIGDLPFDGAGVGLRAGPLRGLGDAEVEQLDDALVADHHVGWRDVAVDDSERHAIEPGTIARVVERRERTHRDVEHERDREQLLPAREVREERADVLAVDVLHGEEVRATEHADIEHLGDVRMLELCSEPRLVEKHLRELGIAAALGEHALCAVRRRPQCSPGPGRCRPSLRSRVSRGSCNG